MAVGTSGIVGKRLATVVASGRRFPDLMCEVIGARNSKITAASPLFAAVTTSPVALYGTIWKFAPVVDLKSSAARFCVLPMPMVPTFSLPGFFFAAATKSCTFLKGDFESVMITSGKKPTVLIISKSRSGS